MSDHPDTTQHIINAVLGGTVVAAMLQYIPFAAAFVGLLFYALQIWESKTVQAWITQCRTTRKARQLLRMQNAIKAHQVQLEFLQRKLKGLTES